MEAEFPRDEDKWIKKQLQSGQVHGLVNTTLGEHMEDHIRNFLKFIHVQKLDGSIGFINAKARLGKVSLQQVLADSIEMPCRVAKGCKYCNRNDAASCLAPFGLDRAKLFMYACIGLLLICFAWVAAALELCCFASALGFRALWSYVTDCTCIG